MPTLKEIRRRFDEVTTRPVLEVHRDEVLVADYRGQLSPSQHVERKVTQALDGELLAHLQSLRTSRAVTNPR
jgi:hypothetical protein